MPSLSPPASPRQAEDSSSSSPKRSPKLYGRLAASLPRRKAKKTDPSQRVHSLHKEQLKKVNFYSDEIDRMTAIVEKRKFILATLHHSNEKLDKELHDLSVETSTSLAGQALDDVQAKVDRTSEALCKKLERRCMERTQAADKEESLHAQLKSKINSIRKSRQQMGSVISNLKIELESSKAQIQKHLTDLNKAQEGRLETESHVIALKQMLDGVEHTFTAEWSGLTERLVKERSEIQKVQQIAAAESLMKSWQNEVGRDGTILEAVREHELNEIKIKGKMQEQKLEAQQAQLKFQQQQEELSDYCEALTILNRRLGVKSSEGLIQTFDDSETTIFSLMRQVVEATADAEAAEAKYREVKSNLILAQEGDKSRYNSLKEEATLMKKRRKMIEKSISDMDANTEILSELQEVIAMGTQSVYNLLGCSTLVPSATALGESELTMANMESYLGVIEQRVAELILMANTRAKKMNSTVSSVDNIATAEAEAEEVVADVDDRMNSDGDEDNDLDLTLNNEITAQLNAAKLEKEIRKMKESSLRKREQRELEIQMRESQINVGPVSPTKSPNERKLQVNLTELSQHLALLDKQEEQEKQQKLSFRKARNRRRRKFSNSSIDLTASEFLQKQEVIEEDTDDPVVPLSREELLRNITARYS